MKKLFINKQYIGHYYQEVDGFWVFEPKSTSGYWNEYLLLIIMFKMRELNATWDLQIMTDPKISNLGTNSPTIRLEDEQT